MGIQAYQIMSSSIFSDIHNIPHKHIQTRHAHKQCWYHLTGTAPSNIFDKTKIFAQRHSVPFSTKIHPQIWKHGNNIRGFHTGDGRDYIFSGSDDVMHVNGLWYHTAQTAVTLFEKPSFTKRSYKPYSLHTVWLSSNKSTKSINHPLHIL